MNMLELQVLNIGTLQRFRNMSRIPVGNNQN